MSILSRFVNRLHPHRLHRDVHDEVEFHIDMRTKANLKTGLTSEAARDQAHRQFGDLEAVMAEMRQERLASLVAMFTLMAALAVFVMSWIAQQQLARMDLMMPAAPTAPRLLPPATLQEALRDPHRPRGAQLPPPPGPGPTWEQYVKQTKAFEALEKEPGRYSPGRMFNDNGQTR
jgi:hypothetical protein